MHEHSGGRKFAEKVINPFESEYDTPMDSSAELRPILLNYYRAQICVLIRTVELGRIDIIAEVSMLAPQLALSQEGHLEGVFHIYGYLKDHRNARMIFDPTYPTSDTSMFQEHDWCDFYGGVKGGITPDVPEPRGQGRLI